MVTVHSRGVMGQVEQGGVNANAEAEAFIPNPNGYTEVNHKDEDKTNNRRRISYNKTIAARG